ncbi:MAG: hypothetical protein IPK71_35795 [Myxococcales bacterium]|nr:hypothetical protein [Myxococcales bacterium]
MATKSKHRNLFAFSLVVAASFAPAAAYADDDVEIARKAFTAGYAEEQAGHFAAALEKFLEVQRVKDTASVRYRIGACHEGLGRFDRARETYLSIEKVARPEDKDVVASGAAKAKELEAKLGELSLRVECDASAARVSIDGSDVPLQNGQASVFLGPGEHRVTYEPKGEPPVVTPIRLDAGKQTVLVLNRAGTRAGAAPDKLPTPPPPVQTDSSTSKTVGVVGIVVGAAFVVGSVVSFVLRESAISSIETDCPEGRCPKSKEGDVTSARSRAEALLPVGIVTGVVGGVALGGGLYLTLRPTSAPAGASRGTTGMTFGLEVPWR